MTVLLTYSPRSLVRFRYLLRKINRTLNLKQLWYKDNGNWHWLKEKPTPIASLNRSIWRLSVPSFSFHFMLGLSSIIATLGLLANSAAVIIGAMIVAPLMGPIVGMAYSTAMGNRKLLRRSSFTVLKGILLTIGVAWLVTSIIGLETVDSEILSRTKPTLIDFGIAMAAGAAGAFANTRRSISSAMPGVAIADNFLPYAKSYDVQSNYGFWAMVEKFGQEFIGWIFLRPEVDFELLRQLNLAELDATEIGYRIRRSSWNQDYTTEATKALIDRSFRESNIAKISAWALKENRASTRVMEKAGLELQHEYLVTADMLPPNLLENNLVQNILNRPFVRYQLIREF
ncbi:MAG: GNAT family N-acetyltransferase [Cyanobacteria bacterium P01_A01_bin.83]